MEICENNVHQFLDSLYFKQINVEETIEKFLHYDLESSYESHPFNLELEKQSIKAEEENIENNSNLILDYKSTIHLAEESLQQSQEAKSAVKSERKKLDDQIINVKQKVKEMKLLRKPSSCDRKLIQSKRNILRVLENLFKMKVHEIIGSELHHKVQGFIYNKNSSYIKNFTVPKSEINGWNLIAPAAHLDWKIDQDEK